MNCRRCFALLGAIITMQWVSCPAFSQDREPHSLEPVTKIVLGAAGSQVMRFGDLDGDGMPEGIAIQNHKRQITALTAFRLDGSILWQIGEPNASNRGTSSDLPVQIFDIDGDGKDEVICVREGKFNILNGSNGALLREASATQQDSIYLGNFLRGGATGILIKDRYRSWSVYNTDLQLQWSGKGNLGHYPMSYDFNGDGTEEIIIGFSMYSFNKELWSVKLTHHNDATAVADMDGDGRPEIAIASSGDAVLLNPRGEVLWVKRLGHAQHAIIGSFDWNTPSRKQAVFVDRAANGRIHAYDKAGNELWNLPPQGRITMAMSVKGWTGHRGEDLVLLSRRQAGPPVLVDGHGKIVAELPFPPAKFASTEGLQNKNKTYDKYYVQHYDLLGDGREEIVVYDKNELWIYSNPSEAPANINVSEGFPNRRAYNNTFYTGVQ